MCFANFPKARTPCELGGSHRSLEESRCSRIYGTLFRVCFERKTKVTEKICILGVPYSKTQTICATIQSLISTVKGMTWGTRAPRYNKEVGVTPQNPLLRPAILTVAHITNISGFWFPRASLQTHYCCFPCLGRVLARPAEQAFSLTCATKSWSTASFAVLRLDHGFVA